MRGKHLRFAEPLFCLDGGRLYAACSKDFFLTNKIIPGQPQLLANVGSNGRAELEWVLDFDGQFFELRSLGLVPKSLLQMLGLTKQKERYEIENPRPITVRELKVRITSAKDHSPEAPVASSVYQDLVRLPDKLIIDRTVMNKLMGG